MEHLEELRQRIFKSLIAVVLGAIVAFIFRVPIMNFLTLPLPKSRGRARPKRQLGCDRSGGRLHRFPQTLPVAVGILIAIPVILYQIWAFVSPGLYPKEKKTALPFRFPGHLPLSGRHRGGIPEALRFPVQLSD